MKNKSSSPKSILSHLIEKIKTTFTKPIIELTFSKTKRKTWNKSTKTSKNFIMSTVIKTLQIVWTRGFSNLKKFRRFLIPIFNGKSNKNDLQAVPLFKEAQHSREVHSAEVREPRRRSEISRWEVVERIYENIYIYIIYLFSDIYRFRYIFDSSICYVYKVDLPKLRWKLYQLEDIQHKIRCPQTRPWCSLKAAKIDLWMAVASCWNHIPDIPCERRNKYKSLGYLHLRYSWDFTRHDGT